MFTKLELYELLEKDVLFRNNQNEMVLIAL
ncbi:hypothetical protein SAMN04488104_10477 [Algoriphagus faecimaris]|uniref:Uncharacterized protein n=1 Tax=Algoriphagus faecimaris TaxID=686796 RepID=A0A1G6WRV7_9BACT|nr:hypothetical protein SAMN04488104_10477 [Algoriphagus faecimaris]